MSGSRRRASESLSNPNSADTTRHTRSRTIGAISSTAQMMRGLNLPPPPTPENKDEIKPSQEIRPRTRSITAAAQTSENIENNKTNKQFMYLLANGEKDMIRAAETWRSEQRIRRELIIDSRNQSLRSISADDILYIHSHTFVDSATHESKGTIGGRMKSGIDVKFNSQQLAEHLETQGLSKDHKKLKVFCCYSDKIADSLYKALNNRGFHQIEIYGYKGEVTLLGLNFHKAAGLTVREAEILTSKYRDASGNLISTEGVIKETHRAKGHRVIMDKVEYALKHPESIESRPAEITSPRMR